MAIKVEFYDGIYHCSCGIFKMNYTESALAGSNPAEVFKHDCIVESEMLIREESKCQ